MFRPRFTVRTLSIFVTLICAYFAAWDATKRFGLPIRWNNSDIYFNPLCDDDDKILPVDTEITAAVFVDSVICPIPLVVKCTVLGSSTEFYYVWLFGPKIKLPFESKD